MVNGPTETAQDFMPNESRGGLTERSPENTFRYCGAGPVAVLGLESPVIFVMFLSWCRYRIFPPFESDAKSSYPAIAVLRIGSKPEFVLRFDVAGNHVTWH